MSLRKQAASGVKWMTASAAAANALQFAQRVLLARLLVPADFGLAGMTFVVVGFAEVFADLGLGSAIIQRKIVTRNELSSLYWLNVLVGLVVFAVIVTGAPWIADFFGQPRLLHLLPWAGLNFLIVPFGQQFQVLLQREMQFGRLAKIEVAAQVAGTVAAVWSALAGRGVFALIFGLLVTAALRTILLVGLGWRRWTPAPHFGLADLRGYMRFGAFRLADYSAFYFSSNIDTVIIGRYLGADALGMYTLALQLVVWPLTKINPVIGRVAFPVLSRVQDDDAALRRGFLEMAKALVTCLFPLLAILGASAQWLVPFVFGSKWAGSAVLLQLLIPVGLAKTLAVPSAQVLLAKGRPDLSFLWTLLAGVMNAVAFWLIVGSGPRAVALANSVLTLLLLPLGFVLLYYAVHLEPMSLVESLALPTALSLLLGIGLYGSYALLSRLALSHVVLMASLPVLGLAVYLALAWRLDREYVRRVSALVFGAR